MILLNKNIFVKNVVSWARSFCHMCKMALRIPYATYGRLKPREGLGLVPFPTYGRLNTTLMRYESLGHMPYPIIMLWKPHNKQ